MLSPEFVPTTEEVKSLIWSKPGTAEYVVMREYAVILRGSTSEAQWRPFLLALEERVPKLARLRTDAEREFGLGRLWIELLGDRDGHWSWLDDFLTKSSRRSCEGFLAARVANAARSERRKQRRHAKLDALQRVLMGAGNGRRVGSRTWQIPDSTAFPPNPLCLMTELLSPLGERDARVLFRVLEGQCAPAIATEIGCTPRTIRNVIARLLERVDELLGDERL